MAALALGIASLVVFVAPAVAIVVPVAGVVAGAAALLRMRRDPSLAGRLAAIAGLALAVFSLAAGPTYWLVREWQLRSAAESVARSFVERLIEGDSRSAHQMTLPPERRFATDRPLADSYRDNALARDDLVRFTREEVVRRLRALRGENITRVELEWHESHRGVDWFGVVVESGEDSSESAPEFQLRLLIKRTADESGGVWIVDRYFLNGKYVLRNGRTVLEER